MTFFCRVMSPLCLSKYYLCLSWTHVLLLFRFQSSQLDGSGWPHHCNQPTLITKHPVARRHSIDSWNPFFSGTQTNDLLNIYNREDNILGLQVRHITKERMNNEWRMLSILYHTFENKRNQRLIFLLFTSGQIYLRGL